MKGYINALSPAMPLFESDIKYAGSPGSAVAERPQAAQSEIAPMWIM